MEWRYINPAIIIIIVLAFVLFARHLARHLAWQIMSTLIGTTGSGLPAGLGCLSVLSSSLPEGPVCNVWRPFSAQTRGSIKRRRSTRETAISTDLFFVLIETLDKTTWGHTVVDLWTRTHTKCNILKGACNHFWSKCIHNQLRTVSSYYYMMTVNELFHESRNSVEFRYKGHCPYQFPMILYVWIKQVN